MEDRFRVVAVLVAIAIGWAFGLGLALVPSDGLDVARAEGQQPAETWTLSLAGIPDSAGRGGYACQGCDGYFTGADAFAAAGRRLEPVTVRIYYGGPFRFLEEDPQDVYIPDPAPTSARRPSATPTPSPSPTPIVSPTPAASPTPAGLLWEGQIERGEGTQLLQAFASINVPPPYVVYLTRNPEGYAVCPNTPHLLYLTQDDFDRARASRPGRGRSMEIKWSFWTCPTAELGADLPLNLGIHMWLDLVRSSSGHNPSATRTPTPVATP